jgi:hypothetical protein
VASGGFIGGPDVAARESDRGVDRERDRRADDKARQHKPQDVSQSRVHDVFSC